MTVPAELPRPRSKPLIVAFVALSLLSCAQALAPAPASAAAEDGGWCFRVVNGSVVFDNDCEGAGETIVIVDKKPEPNRPPSGPGFDPGIGGERGLLGARPRGGGGHSGAITKKKEPPLPAWPPERVRKRAEKLRDYPVISCADFYLDIQKYHWETAKIETGEWSMARFLLAGSMTRRSFADAKKKWSTFCRGPVPDDET